jgi:hypothetical protein
MADAARQACGDAAYLWTMSHPHPGYPLPKAINHGIETAGGRGLASAAESSAMAV